MQISPRIKHILQILLDSTEPVSEQEIASKIGVSKRTIQREIEYISSGMNYYGLTLYKKKNIGMWLAGETNNIDKLKKELLSYQVKDITDKDKRIRYLIFELLRDRVPKKMYYFSDMYGVSEATISSDLELAEEWLARNHVSVIRKPGYGIMLKGKEKDYRAAVQRFIKENVDDESMRLSLYKNETAVMDAFIDTDKHTANIKNFYELLNSEILAKVSMTLQNMNEPRLSQMTEGSYIGLILHITIALDRILKDIIIEQNEYKTIITADDEDYELAVKVISRLEEVFLIKIPKVEMDYVILHIKGSKIGYSSPENINGRYSLASEKILDIIDQMIDKFNPEVAFELKCDEEFIQGLLVHLEPAIIRLKNDLSIYNPLLNEIKNEYSELFEQCSNISKVITKEVGVVVNDEEIGYIAMHFEAALERVYNRKNTQRSVNIGIICASGFGVARLMMSKLKNHIKQEVILKAYGKEEITSFVVSKMDFFVSSIPYEFEGIDFIKVSPLISSKDLQQIETKIKEYSHMPSKMQETDFTKHLDDINIIIMQIKNLISIYRNIEIAADSTLETILSTIAKEVTKSQQSAAVLKSEFMEREKIMSQIFPDNGFALFHCRTKTVKEAAFYTCTPQIGTYFKDPYMKKIKAAIVLLMPQDSYQRKYSDILGFISSSLIDDKEFLETIFNSREDMVRSKLQKILKKYFEEYVIKI